MTAVTQLVHDLTLMGLTYAAPELAPQELQMLYAGFFGAVKNLVSHFTLS